MSLALKLALSPVLAVQALRTRAKTPRLPEAAGPREGVQGRGAPLRVWIAGDSSAAGVGVAHQRDALAGRLVAQLAERCRARVTWRLTACSGLNSIAVLKLLRESGPWTADVAVVVSGVNDVVDQLPSTQAVAAREATANWLRNAAGVQHVVFMPLPPIGRFPALPQPLRWVAGADARRHDQALQRWAATREDVSAPAVELNLGTQAMADDGFHPGAPVYHACAEALAEHVAARVWPRLRTVSP